jgi:riboflavin transporter FmnP
MLAGTALVTFVACLSNVYFIIPFYTKLYGMSMEAIIAMKYSRLRKIARKRSSEK